jgi:hypothetical protein
MLIIPDAVPFSSLVFKSKQHKPYSLSPHQISPEKKKFTNARQSLHLEREKNQTKFQKRPRKEK